MLECLSLCFIIKCIHILLTGCYNGLKTKTPLFIDLSIEEYLLNAGWSKTQKDKFLRLTSSGLWTITIAGTNYTVSLDNTDLDLSIWGFPVTCSIQVLSCVSILARIAKRCEGKEADAAADIKLLKSMIVTCSNNGHQIIHHTKCPKVVGFLKLGNCCDMCYQAYRRGLKAGSKACKVTGKFLCCLNRFFLH